MPWTACPSPNRNLELRALDLEHDLAGRATRVDQAEGLRRSLEREARADDRLHVALIDEARDLGADLALDADLVHHVGAPARADDLQIAQQQAVDPHLGDRTARETHHHAAPALAQ